MSSTSRSRIHPLMAAAAVSTTLVSVMGIAALSGVLPWMPISATQRPVAGAIELRAASGASAMVVPTASLKTAAPLTVADSLAPGESLVGGDNLSASRNVTSTSVPAPAVLTLQAVPGIQSSGALPKTAPAHMTLANTITPVVSTSNAVAAPVVIAPAPRVVAVVAAPRKLEVARQPQSASSNDAANPLLRERRRARDMAMVTSSGISSNGTSASGTGSRTAVRSPQYRTVPNEQRFFSNARGSSNSAPRITPIYRGDDASGPVPPVIYQDQPPPLQVQRSSSRASGDLAIVSDRYRSDQNRRYVNNESLSNGYPVAPTSNGSERENLNGNTTGTAIGRVVSKGIDKTISVISDVLNGRYVPPPPNEPQDGIYR